MNTKLVSFYRMPVREFERVLFLGETVLVVKALFLLEMSSVESGIAEGTIELCLCESVSESAIFDDVVGIVERSAAH